MTSAARPANWKPPYPAYWPRFDEGDRLVAGYFGLQNATEQESTAFNEWITRAFGGPYPPGHWERGWFDDLAGVRNELFVGYWRDADDHRLWRESGLVRAFWNDEARVRGKAGYWTECLTLPTSHFETLFSSPQVAGVAKLASRIGGEVDEHAYWGAARDRIPALAAGDLPGPPASARPTRVRVRAVAAQRVVIRPPEHLCWIHSAQDWADCPPAQKEFYLERVQPHLEAGLGYLARHPTDSGCLASRYVRELTRDGEPTERTYAMCYFQSFKHLEDWAREHPSHLAIFGSFMTLAREFNFEVQLRLWHQVAILPPASPPFEYLNCHPQTGLLSHVD